MNKTRGSTSPTRRSWNSVSLFRAALPTLHSMFSFISPTLKVQSVHYSSTHFFLALEISLLLVHSHSHSHSHSSPLYYLYHRFVFSSIDHMRSHLSLAASLRN